MPGVFQNIDPPPPSLAGECVPPPPFAGGGGGTHFTRWPERRWGVYSLEDPDTALYSIYVSTKYFVIKMLISNVVVSLRPPLGGMRPRV
jgi:hypothetical protein